ncbi:hypothetical protein [Winogradskyella ludwigii]|uniref:hypothetical protein n=1 Tax=Winogradskyella ludwigii TaxID=2686076 RepID=UPI0015C7BC9C|nr:hypothetical protein [Winogradskyella ludwigii]
MDLQKSQLDQLNHLFKSCETISSDIADISGEDKTTVTLLTVGLILAITGFLRSVNS